jgi:hypothetical protein
MDGFGDAFANFFKGIIIIAVVSFIVAVIGMGYICYSYFFKDNSITSDKLIVPEIKLIVKDNKVDTLYIYKQTK